MSYLVVAKRAANCYGDSFHVVRLFSNLGSPRKTRLYSRVITSISKYEKPSYPEGRGSVFTVHKLRRVFQNRARNIRRYRPFIVHLCTYRVHSLYSFIYSWNIGHICRFALLNSAIHTFFFDFFEAEEPNVTESLQIS